ncbi:MAG: cell wall hydrolase [Novosphingobium sp.]|nr:cell wall hydrolase [Novosphingobium sp.]
MNDGTILELGADALGRQPAARWATPRNLAAGTALFALLLAGLPMVSGGGYSGVWQSLGFGSPARAEASIRVNLAAKRAVAGLTEGKQAEIVVEGLAAQQRNALIPLSTAPVEAMRSFLISKAVNTSGAGPMGNALTCLSQAVYYEAAYEPLVGRRAVAQVVLNRMRHPAYPKSVCGVVYQGWERTTGCQFSFTCDGSLLRRPSAAAWKVAQDVARAALSGHVAAEVGSATHYHADYVLPKWAFNLAKIEQIGAHIFYRFPGSWGRAGAFTGGYSGVERIPSLNYAALQARLDAEAALGDAGLPADLIIAPDPTDRHTATDVGGRINPLKQWRLAIPAPDEASSRYQAAIDEQDVSSGPIPVSNSPASAVE